MSAPGPTLLILGVYKPEIPVAVYEEQWRVTGSDEQTRAHFEGLVLIEAVVTNADGNFKAIELGQLYQDHFQCAYDEALLSADGQELIDRRMDCVTGTGSQRFAFYLHFLVSDRLKRLVPYNACT